MAFDAKKFLKTQFEARTEDVSVPDLKEFFPEGENPVWVVRGLTGHELGQVQEARERSRNLEAILEKLLSAAAEGKAEAVKEMLGLGQDTPADIVRRLEMLVLGSVNPACNQELAVRICTYYPIEFMTLTNTISKLTGMGASVKKKPTSSGAKPKSATA